MMPPTILGPELIVVGVALAVLPFVTIGVAIGWWIWG